MNKIIITGSSGKLGNHLVNSLSTDFKIFHFGRKKRKFDLTKKKKFENYILQIKPDFIINCAAITDIETCEFKKKHTEKVNVGIVKNLIDTKSPNPSVETFLHAFLPFKFVDHTHSDAIMNVTNRPGGLGLCKKIFGKKVSIVPYVMPGFGLAKKINEVYSKNPNINCLYF